MSRYKKSFWIAMGGVFIVGWLFFYGLHHIPNTSMELPLFNKKAPGAGVAQEGKWTLVQFWDISCIVCAQEAPLWNDFLIQAKHSSIPVILYSVNIEDSQSQIQDWQRKYHWNFPVKSDLHGELSLNYGVTGTPETFFISPQGLVKYRLAGEATVPFLFKTLQWLSLHPAATYPQILEVVTTFN